MSHLVSFYTQIHRNLQRTASKGLISLLNHQQLEELSFKHFSCINKETGQIGYQCPYTGLEFYNYEDIILEHIIPVSSMGGTVLFNCIPAYKGINGSNQKGANHLLDWWKNKGKQYYTPERLDKLLSYMFDAYDIVFANYSLEEIENSYEDIDLDENIFREYYNTEQSDNNPEDIKELSKEAEELKKQAKKTGVISYLGFINDCLRELKENNYNTTKYEEKLKEYEKHGYFENIERYTLFQNSIKDIIENILDNKKTSLLTYTINFNISKLMDSMKEYESKEDIKNEIEKRLNNIERILQENNISIVEYFKSLRDIQDIDILYKNISDITSNEVQIFLENIEIGLDRRIDIFINMLNQKNSQILKRNNNLTLDGYPNIKLSQFWNNHQDKITTILFKEEKDNLEFESARQTILIYFNVKSYEELKAKQSLTTNDMIRIYIDMLNKGNSQIIKRDNNLTLDGYSSISLSRFWSHYQDRITTILFKEEKENLEFESARQTILIYFNVKSYEELKAKQSLTTNDMIRIYIDMLNKGNSQIIKQGNNLTLDGYPSISLSYFWRSYQDRITTILFKEEKDNLEFESARQTILIYFNVKSYEELKAKQSLTTNDMIRIYIDMLNKGNSQIIKQGNNLTLDGYPNVKLKYFWSSHQDEITTILFEEEKDNLEFESARQTILTYFNVRNFEELEFIKQNNLHLRIFCFIQMLNNGNKNIFKSRNKEFFEGYTNIPVGNFWHTMKNREIIIQTLFVKLKDNSSHDTAKKLILENLEVKNIEEYYEKIEIESKKMKDNKKIKKQLEETIRLVDETYKLLDNEEQRKRA